MVAQSIRGPLHVDFNLTNACDMTCSHCHSSSGKRWRNELTTSEIIKSIKDFHSIGCVSIAFAGGEPFVRKDIVKILKSACEMPGWSVSVITNGLALSNFSFVKELYDECPDLSINISIESSNHKDFGRIRRSKRYQSKELFRKIIDSVSNCQSVGFSTSTNMTITKSSVSEIAQTHQFLIKETGVESLVAIKFFPAGYGLDTLSEFDVPFDLWSHHFAELTKMKLNNELLGLQVSVASPWEFYLPLIAKGVSIQRAESGWKYSRRPVNFKLKQNIGTAGISEVAFAPDGTIFPSILMLGDQQARCGNIRSSSIHEIWNSSPLLLSLRNIQTSDLPITCQKCSALTLCGGGSRARALSLVKDIFGPDITCPFLKNQKVVPSNIDHIDASYDLPNNVVETYGIGMDAVRLFWGKETVQLRTITHVFDIDPCLTKILRWIINSPNGNDPERIMKELNLSESDFYRTVHTELGHLIKLGIDSFISDHWKKFCLSPLRFPDNTLTF